MSEEVTLTKQQIREVYENHPLYVHRDLVYQYLKYFIEKDDDEELIISLMEIHITIHALEHMVQDAFHDKEETRFSTEMIMSLGGIVGILDYKMQNVIKHLPFLQPNLLLN